MDSIYRFLTTQRFSLSDLGVLVVSVPAVIAAFWWVLQQLIDHRLKVRLQKRQSEYDKELEGIRLDHQRQIKQMEHSLESRLSRVHEKEFEVLPRVCSWLYELQGHVSRATEWMPLPVPDFIGWTEESFDAFVDEEPHLLNARQKKELRLSFYASPKSARDYYVQQMKYRNFTEAKKELRMFVNYLLQQRLFITKENDLRSKVEGAKDAMVNALSTYDAGEKSMAYAILQEVQSKIDAVESAIQMRLNAL